MNRIYPTQYQQNVSVPTNYMTYDNSSLNPYDYKDFGDKNNVYQQYQDMIYFTRNPLPASIIDNNQITRDPSNLPCDSRTMIYAQGDANNNELLNLQRSITNNPNTWRDKQPAPAYYNTYEHQIAPRPISYIKMGHATTEIDSHGFIIN